MRKGHKVCYKFVVGAKKSIEPCNHIYGILNDLVHLRISFKNHHREFVASGKNNLLK